MTRTDGWRDQSWKVFFMPRLGWGRGGVTHEISDDVENHLAHCEGE